jgi:drug/metabolite transporter (DMT)-like permease
MRNETKGTLAIVGSSLGYGGLAVLSKIAFERGVDVVPMLAWRFIVASIVLWGVRILLDRRLPTRDRIGAILSLGVLYSGNSLTFMLGLDRIPASLASLVFFTYPVVVVLITRIWFGERLTRRRLTALVAATIGCGLIVGQGISTVDVIGILWILLAVGMIAGFIVRSHVVLADVPAIGGTAVLLTTTAVIMTLTGLAWGGVAVPTDTTTLLVLAALGLTSTAIPVTLFLLGIQWIGPAKASIFSTMEPLVTVLLAMALLGERLLPLQLVGGLLILGGVVWLRLERTGLEDAPH